jgi:methylmalonyl-CoA carboxyltransferase small subunit
VKLNIVVGGRTFEVEVEEAEPSTNTELPAPTSGPIHSSVLPTAPKPASSSQMDESKVCRSPLAGIVVRVHVKPGDQVRLNDLLLVLDAMKMEIKINAQTSGIVKSVEVASTEAVKPEQILVSFE